MFIDPDYFLLPDMQPANGQGSIYYISPDTCDKEIKEKANFIGFISPEKEEIKLWLPEIYKT